MFSEDSRSDSSIDLHDCTLCPHECHVDRAKGQVGRCKATDEMLVSRAALHFWEEPPISGSSGSGTIFFSNCNLGCIYCQNYAISRGGAGEAKSIEDIVDSCLELERKGAMNINFVTPTHYAPQIRKSIELARKRGLSIPVVWNTSGYEGAQSIRDNDGYVDVYLTDFKYHDDVLAKELSGVSNYRDVAIRALDEMVMLAGPPKYDEFKDGPRLISGVVIRHMLLPGHSQDSMDILQLLHERYGDEVLVSIMNQYTPVLKTLADAGNHSAIASLAKHPELIRTVTTDEYEQVLDFADEIGIKDYFWQDGKTCTESFIPSFV